MTTDQKEKRNDEYNKYVKRVTPTHCLSANMLKAFILGGIICTIPSSRKDIHQKIYPQSTYCP